MNVSATIRICVIILSVMPMASAALSHQETYKYKRMWPTLEQPWYFYEPSGVDVDSDGYVYVVNKENDCIQKFTSDGKFITKWGKEGKGDGEFIDPFDIAIDDARFVYITDMNNYRIQKFTSHGEFKTKWGKKGMGDGEFDLPHGISADNGGFVYVVDTQNHRVQKFNSDGKFITKWGERGNGDGEFQHPFGITIDSGVVYVTDTYNYRIQKFTSDGEFKTKWRSEGGGIRYPYGIGVDKNNSVYVTEGVHHELQKFTSEGTFVMKWGEKGREDGRFYSPHGMAIDQNGYVYVADMENHRIQKFDSDGQFVDRWGISSEDGNFNSPYGIAIDNGGNLFVADTRNNQIQKFISDGENLVFAKKWGEGGKEDGKFREPHGIAVDRNGFVYVTDKLNHRVQKFTSQGEFVDKWGEKGDEDGNFNQPHGLAVDGDGHVYVADFGNRRIQKFTSGGVFKRWGSESGEIGKPYGIATDSENFVYMLDVAGIHKFTPDGEFVGKWGKENGFEFNSPRGVTVETVDDRDFIYVADSENYRIQKFTSEGQFVTKWGERGNNPGQMSYPSDVAIHPNGDVYVADTDNHRIQMFTKTDLLSKSKAVIVAGGGPFPGNHLWDATQMCANFAYRTLAYQGFTRETICYLTSDTDLDLNDDGEPDVKDAVKSNLPATWSEDADNLVIYLVDHGGKVAFLLNGTETLSFSELRLWLDSLQETISGKMLVIYDACNSGNLLQTLESSPDKERIVITSTSPDENAHFISQGSISFSNFFWTNIFNGDTIEDAFNFASSAIVEATEIQNPLMQGNGGFTMGNGTLNNWESPEIADASFGIVDETSRSLYADAMDEEGIARVWAIILPPDYHMRSSDNPVLELPSIELTLSQDNQHRYEARYDGFNLEGMYNIAIYARDRIGDTSQPKLISMPMGNPLKHKVIIAAGGGSPSGVPWSAIRKNAESAHNALISQWYTDHDIYFMSPEIFSDNVRPITLDNMRYAIKEWASQDSLDLVLYLVGNGNKDLFHISDTEHLSAADLDTWLDHLQEKIPGRVTVGYDADYSGSFLSKLKPSRGKERILITSTSEDQKACFLSDGDISFSAFFWKEVWKGENLRKAFYAAENSVRYFADYIRPQLDDTGNGVGNETGDGQLAMNHTIGAGIRMVGNEPLVSVPSDVTITLAGERSATVWVENVTSTGTLESLWGMVIPPRYDPERFFSAPDGELPTFPLSYSERNARYEGTYNDFSLFGEYQVVIHANDTDGNLSSPEKISVCQSVGPDIYEPDDSRNQADFIGTNENTLQHRSLHTAKDEDWISFYGLAEENYELWFSNTEEDLYVELYDNHGESLNSRKIPSNPNPDAGIWSWKCEHEGAYYIRIIHAATESFDNCTSYHLEFTQPTAFLEGLTVTVTDAVSGEPVEAAEVTISENSEPFIYLSGVDYWWIMHEPGEFELEIKAPGYAPLKTTISTDDEKTGRNILLSPYHSADYNNPSNDKIDLPELLRIIQLYNNEFYGCDSKTEEDGYAPKSGDQSCRPHHSDYKPQNWRIDLSELLRLIQFYNSSGYHLDPNGEDGFAPGDDIIPVPCACHMADDPFPGIEESDFVAELGENLIIKSH